jgi:RNA polymerase sigma-70 factor (ECF subfamily)
MGNTLAALPNEIALVTRAVVEPATFAAIYDHYFPRIYNYMRYRVGDAASADDLTAQVFTCTLAKLHNFQSSRAPFAAWLFAIARNAVTDYLRFQKRHPRLALDTLRDHASRELTPDESVIRNETRDELIAALARVSERERDILALKFAGGLTNRHIAKLVGESESNVGVILFRTVRRLRSELEGIKP